MKLEYFLHRLTQKEKELIDTRQAFLDELQKECKSILLKKIYNRKWKKCLVYLLGIKYKILLQREIADIMEINRTDVVIANADVKRWLTVTECPTIKSYVEEIEKYLD